MGDVKGQVILRRHNGGIQQSADLGATWSDVGGGTAFGYVQQRLAVALNRIGTLNRFEGSDLMDGNFFLGGGVAAPTAISTKSCGVYALSGGGGWINIGHGDSQNLIATPTLESWFVSARVKNPAAAVFTGGTFNVPIGLSQGGHATYIQGNAPTSTTIYQLNLNNGADHFTPLGAGATIGALTCPIGAFYDVSMYFNAVTGVLSVEFSDQLIATFSGAQLANMDTGAASVITWGTDTTMALQVDGMFFAGVAAT